jgi:transposase
MGRAFSLSGVRGVLRGFGLKVGPISRGRFEARILKLVDGHAMLGTVIGAMLTARTALQKEFARLHRALLALVHDDPVCRQLMSVPGVGAIVAITFKSSVDDPARFKRSRDVGPHFGLTPRKYQSGELDVTGRISKVGSHGAHRSLRGRQRHADAHRALLRPQGLGNGGRQAARHEEDPRRARAQACRRPPPHVGRWHGLPLDQGSDCNRIRRALKIGQTNVCATEVPSLGRRSG